MRGVKTDAGGDGKLRFSFFCPNHQISTGPSLIFLFQHYQLNTFTSETTWKMFFVIFFTYVYDK